MARIHVFAIDWVPAAGDIASGGGLRSLQVIEALRLAGHAVTFSVPADARQVRRLGPDHPSVRALDLHTQHNQIDLLRRNRPQVVFWLAPLIRCIPFTGLGDLVHVCDLVGLPHIEAALGVPALERPLRERLVRLCQPADLVLTGSEEQNGFWLAELSRDRAPPQTAVIPYALPAGLDGKLNGIKTNGGKASLRTLHVTGMVYAWSTSVSVLQRVADWVEARQDVTLSLVLGTDPGGATDRATLQALHQIAERPRVAMHGELSFADAMALYGSGSVALDLYEPTMERRMAVPIRSVNALTRGVPVLATVSGTFMQRVAAAHAGFSIGTDVRAALDQLASTPPAGIAAMSRAAAALARQEYNAAAIADHLAASVQQAIDRSAGSTVVTAAAPRPPHVLVISDVEPHHLELRTSIPLDALYARQQVSGYSVWTQGAFVFTTSSDIDNETFDAIWVQRKIGSAASLALRMLDRPFIYDIDDNLLSSPAYRPAFPADVTQSVRNLVWSCNVLSCSTARLGQLLGRATTVPMIDKVIVTPNLLRAPPLPRPVGTPRFLVWVSSDTPALAESRQEVIRALRDFCLSHDLTLACIGADPPDLIVEAEVRVTHVRQVPYGSYLSLLRSFAPAILACPLETASDPATLDFVNGKSDIKLLEALSAGLVGVFSRAPPYLDSDLPAQLLCENTYRGWMEALARAWRLSSWQETEADIPEHRYVSDVAMKPWQLALARARMPQPLSCARFKDALACVRGRYGRRPLLRAEFDEAYYTARYPDVGIAVAAGAMKDAFEHYRDYGFYEGRAGHEHDGAEQHNDQVWTNLFNTLGDLDARVSTQERYLATLQARRATRLAVKRRAQ